MSTVALSPDTKKLFDKEYTEWLKSVMTPDHSPSKNLFVLRLLYFWKFQGADCGCGDLIYCEICQAKEEMQIVEETEG